MPSHCARSSRLISLATARTTSLGSTPAASLRNVISKVRQTGGGRASRIVLSFTSISTAQAWSGLRVGVEEGWSMISRLAPHENSPSSSSLSFKQLK
jgi:hypothetical protein